MIKQIPTPPNDKHYWPWNHESEHSEIPWSYKKDLPKVSIVTSSLNQGKFIEETIRSVLLQGYPNLEYIIIDGGSTDNTVEIIKKYEKWLTYWVSEKDEGQSHAINKGFQKASGKVYGWINSDDYYYRGAFRNLINLMLKNPDCVCWIGSCQEININGMAKNIVDPRIGDIYKLGKWSGKREKDGAWFAQPSCFFDSKAFKKVGWIDERLHYAMDVDLWIRLRAYGKFASTNDIISCPRMYPEIKTYRNLHMRYAEQIFINLKYGMAKNAEERIKMYHRLMMNKTRYIDLLSYILKRSFLWGISITGKLYNAMKNYAMLCNKILDKNLLHRR